MRAATVVAHWTHDDFIDHRDRRDTLARNACNALLRGDQMLAHRALRPYERERELCAAYQLREAESRIATTEAARAAA